MDKEEESKAISTLSEPKRTKYLILIILLEREKMND